MPEKDSPSLIDRAKVFFRRSEPQLTSVEAHWLEFQNGNTEHEDYVRILHDSDVLPEIQRKAINALASPTNMRKSTYWMKELTDQQIGFASESFITNIQEVYTLLKRTKNDQFAIKDLEVVLSRYNSLIPLLLGRLPKEKAGQLFDCFNIKNTTLHRTDMELFNPLKDLLNNEAIDEELKERATEQMHGQLLDELHEEEPIKFEDYVSARRYKEILESIIDNRTGLPVSREFYQKEIEFMLSTYKDRPIFSEDEYTGKVFKILDDKTIRHEFVRRHILRPFGYGLFRIESNRLAEDAVTIMRAFPEDEELVSAIKEQEHAWLEKARKQFIASELTFRIAQKICNGMEKPAFD